VRTRCTVDQSRYSILCSDLAEARAKASKWAGDARDFVQNFRSGFALYLGSPEHDKKHKEQSVYLSRLVEYKGTIVLSSKVGATKDSDVIILNDEREWVFAIGLKLGEAVDEYVCLCRFAIEDCAVRLYIGHSEEAFLINTDESGSGEPAFAGLYNHYRTLFKLPLNTNPSKKQKMGFI
jgi:hypothetical protein